jgi:hypothetical protein
VSWKNHFWCKYALKDHWNLVQRSPQDGGSVGRRKKTFKSQNHWHIELAEKQKRKYNNNKVFEVTKSTVLNVFKVQTLNYDRFVLGKDNYIHKCALIVLSGANPSTSEFTTTTPAL